MSQRNGGSNEMSGKKGLLVRFSLRATHDNAAQHNTTHATRQRAHLGSPSSSCSAHPTSLQWRTATTVEGRLRLRPAIRFAPSASTQAPISPKPGHRAKYAHQSIMQFPFCSFLIPPRWPRGHGLTSIKHGETFFQTHQYPCSTLDRSWTKTSK